MQNVLIVFCYAWEVFFTDESESDDKELVCNFGHLPRNEPVVAEMPKFALAL